MRALCSTFGLTKRDMVDGSKRSDFEITCSLAMFSTHRSMASDGKVLRIVCEVGLRDSPKFQICKCLVDDGARDR